MTNNDRCPYCKEKVELKEPTLEDLDDFYEHKCPHCNKWFGYWVDFIVVNNLQEMPCWNDGPHSLTLTGKGTKGCLYCDYEEPLKKE